MFLATIGLSSSCYAKYVVKILGIETSCDETAASVVEDGFRLHSNVVASSMDLHVQYGGVVPEIAARSHIEAIAPVITQALADAGCNWGDIDGIAVTYGAGLGGSLLIGVLAARTLAITKNKLLYACNHVIGHVYANFLTSGAHSAVGERSLERDSLIGEARLPSGGRVASLATSPLPPASLRSAAAPRTV